jgi:YggT family protein
MFVASNFIKAIAMVLDTALSFYWWIVIIAVILSWIPLDPYNPTAQTIKSFFTKATEPVFSFVRRKLRLHMYTYPLDFTPVIVLLAISFLQVFLIRSLRQFACYVYPPDCLLR